MIRRLEDVLVDLSALLTSEGYGGHANDVNAVLVRLANNQSEACDLIASLEFWGGAGSVSDVYFCRENLAARDKQERYGVLMERPDSEFAASNRRLSELLAELSEAFVGSCTSAAHKQWHERAQFIGRVHRGWVESGIR